MAGVEAARASAAPVVSVIMSMRDSAATVADAVRSLQLQTHEDWELVVIDDGSRDTSAEIVTAIGDPRIRLVRETESRGLATRLNQAVALARGDLIARMDSDDVCFPDRLARQVEALRRDASLDLIGCGAVVFGAAGLLGVLPVGRNHEEIVARPSRGFPLPHPTWCGRAAWFRRNPYDAKLMNTQDQDLLLRTFTRSRFGCVDEVLFGYRQDSLSLRKLLRGRGVYSRALWQYGRTQHLRPSAFVGIAGQAVKAVVDILTMAVGLDGPMQLQRLRPVPESVAMRWQALQVALRREADEQTCAGGQS